MKVVKQSPDEFIIGMEVEELDIDTLHWWQKIWLKIHGWYLNKFPWIAYRK